jgi:hypothetical protein
MGERDPHAPAFRLTPRAYCRVPETALPPGPSPLAPSDLECSHMVRRDEADRQSFASRCSSPAGASPASVSAGAPSSRPQASREIALAQAGCRKPLRREPARGPQRPVKPTASTHSQSESRAAHVTAKATSAVSQSGDQAADLGGVEGRSTCARRRTEHESPVCAAVVAADRLV